MVVGETPEMKLLPVLNCFICVLSIPTESLSTATHKSGRVHKLSTAELEVIAVSVRPHLPRSRQGSPRTRSITEIVFSKLKMSQNVCKSLAICNHHYWLQWRPFLATRLGRSRRHFAQATRLMTGSSRGIWSKSSAQMKRRTSSGLCSWRLCYQLCLDGFMLLMCFCAWWSCFGQTRDNLFQLTR